MQINKVTPSNINNTTQSKNIAFKGDFSVKDTAKRLFEPARQGNMSRALFLFTAFTFLLSGRLATARDNNERRETLTRDIPTFIATAKGVPWIGRKLAESSQKKSGFVFMQDETNKTLFGKEKTSLEVVCNNKLKDWYVFDSNLASGFDGFMNRLSSLGGNMKKIVSHLGDDIKSKVAQFSDDNVKFIEELSKDSSLKSAIEEAFKSDKNAAFAVAKFKKIVPSLMGYGGTLALIGLCIPNLNIAITESIAKKKKKQQQEVPSNEVKKAEPPKTQVIKSA